MTVVHGAVDDVGLSLQHADAIVELGGHIEVLVAGGVQGDGKGAVMSADVGYVAVGPGTELWVAITGLAGWNWRCAGCGARRRPI